MKKLYLFSYGLYPGQITLETVAAMRECGRIYTHCRLDRGFLDRLGRLGPVRRLSTKLSLGETAAAAAEGLNRHDVVGFLTYGNPLFLNQTAAEVMKAAAGKNAAVRVFEAVSSLDALINLFNLNKYSPQGLRVLDAASFIANPVFTPCMDTLIFVPYVLNSPQSAVRKKKFIAAFRKAYPPAAPVYLAECASGAGRRTVTLPGRAKNLPALLAALNERHTIFIPALAGSRPDRAARGG